jgi:hypothetical protein
MWKYLYVLVAQLNKDIPVEVQTMATKQSQLERTVSLLMTRDLPALHANITDLIKQVVIII